MRLFPFCKKKKTLSRTGRIRSYYNSVSNETLIVNEDFHKMDFVVQSEPFSLNFPKKKLEISDRMSTMSCKCLFLNDVVEK